MIVDRCDFQPGDWVEGRWIVKKTLGEGSFGKVYLITDHNGTQYALKLLRLFDVPPEIRQPLIDRFEMEFKTGQIQCDNLVQSLDFGMTKGNPFIVMEFCPGGDLTPLLGNCGDRAVSICQQILLGLNALHINAKVHRDLKPENVLFKANGQAALTDFGISGDRNHRMTQRGWSGKPNQIFGTYAYMPPEQVNRARGDATVLPTTDIFSFGALAFQLLTGELPFGTLESHNDLANYQKRGKNGDWSRSTLYRIPNGPQWERVIGGCLEPDFKKRLQSVNEVMSLLPQSYNNNAYQPVRQPVMQAYQPQQQTHGYQLNIMAGEDYGKRIDVTKIQKERGGIMTIGRGKDNVIVLKSDIDCFVSRQHCTLAVDEEGSEWLLRNGQWDRNAQKWNPSRNGTFVNSTEVGPTGYYLYPGDIITIGEVKMRFENY